MKHCLVVVVYGHDQVPELEGRFLDQVCLVLAVVAIVRVEVGVGQGVL